MTTKAFQDMNADERIELTQRLRHDVITKLTTDEAGAVAIPMDKDSLYLIRDFLGDTTKIELNKKRFDLDTMVAENDAKAAELLETVVSQFTSPTRGGQRTGSVPKPDLSMMPSFEVSDGEKSDVGDTVDIDQINDTGRTHFKGPTP